MRFGILGPVQIIDHRDRTVATTGRQRILLAALCLQANQVVSTDYLVEALWDGSPPSRPRSALCTVVSRVRAAVGRAEGPIRTTPAGYLLTAGPGELDLLRFREYVRRAGKQVSPIDRAEALDSALALWRGEPLAGVSSDVLERDFAPRLTEERLQAVELQLAVKLDAGQAAAVVADLTDLVTRHPGREKVWALLIRALYRTGRQADAITAYRQVRGYLRDELALTPGSELRELHEAILRADPVLEGPRDQATAPAPSPQQLPPDLSRFTGRTAELLGLDALLGDQDEPLRQVVIVAVGGPAGAGKTALAVHWAHRIRSRFPDGQLYLNLHGFGPTEPMEPALAAEVLLRSLGLPASQVPPGLDARSARLRTALAGKRILVILDNARSADQVRPLLPGSGGLVLVTSRNQLRGLVVRDGAHRLALGPLAEPESADLVRRILGDRATAEPEAVAELTRTCRGLPLALTIAAERASRTPDIPLADLVRNLRDERARLDLLDSGDEDAGSDLRDVLSWSYRALPDDAAALFRLLGIAPGPDIGLAAAAALAGTSIASAGRLLDQLVNANQIQLGRGGRYELHSLVRVHAAELAVEHDAPRRRSAALRRLIEWYTATAFRARPLLQPSETDVEPVTVASEVLTFTSERQAYDWFETERHNLFAAVHRAYELGLDDVCWRLAYGFWLYLRSSAAWDDIVATHNTGLSAARRAGDPLGEARMLTGLGVAYRTTGQPDQAIAHQRKALALFRQNDDQNGITAALTNLGAACRDAGRYDEALRCLRRAYELERGRREFGNMAISLYHTAVTLTAAGRAAEAIDVAGDCLRDFRRIGHRGGEARALLALASAQARSGALPVAIAHYQAAAERFEQLDDRWYHAHVLEELGDALCASGQVTEGRTAWARALEILEQLDTAATVGLRAKLGG